MAPAAANGPGPGQRPTALSAMRYPIFRNVWLASSASHFGGMIQSVGAAWLMLSIAGSADMVALVQASVALPVMLFSLVAGAMADNFDRRRMMLAAQLFMLVVSVALAACAWLGFITPWLLLLFTFLIGCGAAFNAPAWQASVGDMVPRSELPGAVAFNSMGFNFARSVGPAVGGAAGSTRLREATSSEALVRLSCIAFAAGVGVAALSRVLPLTMFALMFCGASWVLALSTFNVTVQLSTPRWVVARALSLYQMAAFGGMALGSWLWGAIAERGDVGMALFGAAAAMLACAALGLWLPLAKLTDLNLDPLRPQLREPATAVPVQPRTGPVVVTIEYVIREADVLEFLGAMAERRRIRRRDGARNWRVLRDLADPEVWIERYESPTWLDYIRHNSRLTHDDAAVPEHLRALHRGSGPPRVRRMIERQPSALHTVPVSGPQVLTEPTSDQIRPS